MSRGPDKGSATPGENGGGRDTLSSSSGRSTDRPSDRPSTEREIIPRIGQRLGKFELVGVLGTGGMGTVYEGRDPELGRTVAIKVMNPDIAESAIDWHRFVSEAQVTAQLEHPSIVPLYSMGVTYADVVYLIMRKVDGVPLSDVLAGLRSGDTHVRENWSRRRLLRAFLQVCEAAGFAHAQGVIHRDLKPANIMLGDFGETLVLDWGLARRLNAEDHGSDGGPERVGESVPETVLVGTPGYMSPEQAMGKRNLDPRSDVWSLGAILYELLTHEPAYKGDEALPILSRTLEGLPTLPPDRAPDLAIPEELTQICNTALANEPEDRYQSAAELASAVQAFLEGTRQRQEADRHLAEAEAVWNSYLAMGRKRDDLLQRERHLADAADAWAPLAERSELLDVREALEQLEPDRARIFGEFIGMCEKALAHVPDHATGRAALAAAYWERLREAEERRDPVEVVYYHDRVSAFDDGSHAALLDGTGTLTLSTDPDGAKVVCERFERRGLVFHLTDRRVLGTTPLKGVPLPMGSYLLSLRAEGRPDMRYPVNIGRCQRWESGPNPLRLQGAEQVAEGFVHVPAGRYLSGGDPEAPGALPSNEVWLDAYFIARLPVTVEQYTEFLNALHARDPEEAWLRCPRSESNISTTDGQYFRRPEPAERYVLPERGPDGNEWHARWPVFGISWYDATAYAAWASARDGVHYRLPLEAEIEKATRGVDGRFYPWGDRFDRTLCKMGESRRGPPQPEPVGAFEGDISVYGVRDLAGSIRDWCGDLNFDGDPDLRPVRGGSWNYDSRFCRAACRLGRPPARIFAYNGFRLARDA